MKGKAHVDMHPKQQNIPIIINIMYDGLDLKALCYLIKYAARRKPPKTEKFFTKAKAQKAEEGSSNSVAKSAIRVLFMEASLKPQSPPNTYQCTPKLV